MTLKPLYRAITPVLVAAGLGGCATTSEEYKGLVGPQLTCEQLQETYRVLQANVQNQPLSDMEQWRLEPAEPRPLSDIEQWRVQAKQDLVERVTQQYLQKCN